MSRLILITYLPTTPARTVWSHAHTVWSFQKKIKQLLQPWPWRLNYMILALNESMKIFLSKYTASVCSTHSNDSHQCPILAADFVIFYYGTENEEAIQAGAGSE